MSDKNRNTKRWEGKTEGVEKMTRQRVRAALVRDEIRAMRIDFPTMPRNERRELARQNAYREYRLKLELQEPR